MGKYVRVSKYHLGIITLYLVVVPFLWFFAPQIFEYRFSNENTAEVTSLIIISLLGFFAYLHLFKKKEIKVKLYNLFRKTPLLLIYSLFFALSEEIIFRGAIQGYFQDHINSTILAVFLASLIFGVVHLPNGAKGVNFRKWNWQFAAIAFLGGVTLGSLFALTSSLLIPTLLHTFFLFVLMIKALSD